VIQIIKGKFKLERNIHIGIEQQHIFVTIFTVKPGIGTDVQKAKKQISPQEKFDLTLFV